MVDSEIDSEKFTVVGIGASAGGLQALIVFFDALPPDTGMAYVVVTHLHPERESLMEELLQNHTEMPVRQVTQLIAVEPNHVYVIPPNRNIVMTDSHLDTAEFEEPHGHRAPIDAFFRSLADVHHNVITIILSGGGSDGAAGIKAIKERGGLLMVQEPSEAEHDSMPRAAIATGLADVVLPVRELAEKLVNYQHQPIHLPQNPEALTLQDQEAFYSVLSQVFTRTGHDFSRYKRSTILRRIQRRMQLNGYATLETYLGYLRDHGEEAQILFNDLLIGVTHFFRDPESWQALAEKVIPKLFEGKGVANSVRVWTVGCATGEEAYSIAILLMEHAATLDIRPQLQVFASDLNENALALGRPGLYSSAIADDVSAERLKRFFVKEGDHYQVRRELRDKVLFAEHSVLRDPPFARLDLLICRNLLIYLERDIQENIFDIFHYALNPQGFLYLGSSETAETSQSLFRVVDKAHRIFQARSWRGEHHHVPSLPLMVSRSPLQKIREVTSLRPSYPGAKDILQLHLEGLETYGPPSILVDENYHILHLSETVGRYLLHPRGPLKDDVVKLVRPELQFEMRITLFEAFEKNKAVMSAPVYVGFNGHSHRVLLSVHPRPSKKGEERISERLALIVFLEEETDEITGTPPGIPAETAERSDPVVTRLEEEVHRLRERLQSNIEDFESFSEELKAANEELQSINEEYRSTTEELETSKEELQSINEELHTVNAELKNKIDEISRAYSDLENLVTATDIATLFLDRDLLIKWYTPGMEKLYNIKNGDRGRPIDHLKNNMGYEQLTEDARRVLQDVIRVERELRGPQGRWFLIRLSPYRTVDHLIDGVVITFVDVTEIKENEISLRTRDKELALAQQSARAGFWTFIPQTKKATVTQIWREIMGLPGKDEALSLEEMVGQVHEEDHQKMATFLSGATPEANSELEFRIHHPLQGERWILSRSQILTPEDGQLPQVYGIMMDITKRKQMENELKSAIGYSEQIVGAVREGLLVMNEDFEIQFANLSFLEKFHLTSEETLGQKIYELGNGQWNIPTFQHQLEEILSHQQAFNNFEVTHEFENIGLRILLLNGRRFKDDQLVLVTIDDITEHRQAMEALYHSEQQLRQLNERLEEKVEERTVELEGANRKLQASSAMFSALFQANPVPTSLARLSDGLYLDVNDEFLGFFEQKRKDVIGRTSVQLSHWLHPEDRETIVERLKKERVIRGVEIDRPLPSGERRTTLLSIELIEVEGIETTLSSFIDITDRVKAEQQAQASSAMFSALFQANPVPTSLTRVSDGSIINVNDEFLDYFGFGRKEILGRAADQVQQGWSTETDRARLIERLQKDGHVRNMELEINHPGGEKRMVLASIEIAPIQKEQVIISSFIDITDRVQAEQEVRDLASQLTLTEQDIQHRISQVLHDDLQQRLYAIELQLNFVGDAIDEIDKEKLTIEIDHIKQELEETIRITRHLSVDLSPPILHDEGLREAVVWLGAQMKERYNLQVDIQSEESFPISETELRVLLFQCVREPLFNIVKHAEVLKAQVTLEKVDHTLHIHISDSGKGFDAQTLKSGEKGLGLVTLHHRLSLFGGELKVESAQGSGTQVSIVAPTHLPERKL